MVHDDEEDEDAEILKSIEYAEKKLGTTMKTPTPVKEHPWSPITYEFGQQGSSATSRIETGALDAVLLQTQPLRMQPAGSTAPVGVPTWA